MGNDEFDIMMKRHAAGDRDPDLISDLDRLAWSAFHDPWEQPADPPLGGVLLHRPFMGSDPYDPDRPEKLELATLNLFVGLRGTSFLRQKSWPFLATYDYLADPEPERCPRIQVESPDGLRLFVRLLRNLDCAETDVPKALDLCRRWNESRPWPEARPLAMDPGNPDAPKVLALEWEVKLPADPPAITLGIFGRVMAELQKAGGEFWTLVDSELTP
jgi:hypothetical protein